MFLSCRPFVVITTLSTGLVGVEVTSVSWLGQLTVSINVVKVIKSKRLRWTGLIVRMEEGGSPFKMLSDEPTRKSLGRPRRRWVN